MKGVRPTCLLSIVLVLTACSREPEQAYVETGDLEGIRLRGRLRILMPPLDGSMLPRAGYSIGHELELAEQFAAGLGLESEVVSIAGRGDLLEALHRGTGDLVLARLTATPERRQRFAFSVPLEYTREVLVTAASDESIREPADLDGRRVAVRASSSFYTTLHALRERVPGLRIVTVPEHWDTEQILSRVGEGEYDATVADEDVVRAVRSYRDDIRQAFALTGPRPIGWAMRPDSPDLKQAVNHFLHEQSLAGGLDAILFGDLEEIRARKVLRVLTRNNSVTTYLHGGQQVGFEFELARAFARSLGCRVQLVIPPDASQLIPWLTEGRGDLIAASMTRTPSRATRVAFSEPYMTVSQLIVARAGEEDLLGPEDLEGRRVVARPSSSYYRTMQAVQQKHQVSFRLEKAAESVETEQLIAGVAGGEHDLTVADSHILDVELAWRDDVQAAFPVGPPSELAWAVRRGDSNLLTRINRFLVRRGPGSQFFNVLLRRYFTDARSLSARLQERPEISGLISPYDDLFRKYGEEFDVDWRLLAAQAYQESRFRPKARSWAGALGIMQVLPRTARSLGISGDLHDPEVSIRAGALYMHRLGDRYYPELPLSERLRFALGAYNAGPGHIMDGRRLARQKGLDDSLWFDNVETVLPLLARSEYARQARSGYCRCSQTVRYVTDIHERYRRYAEVLP